MKNCRKITRKKKTNKLCLTCISIYLLGVKISMNLCPLSVIYSFLIIFKIFTYRLQFHSYRTSFHHHEHFRLAVILYLEWLWTLHWENLWERSKKKKKSPNLYYNEQISNYILWSGLGRELFSTYTSPCANRT